MRVKVFPFIIIVTIFGLFLSHKKLSHATLSFPHQEISSDFRLEGTGFSRNGLYGGLPQGTYGSALSDLKVFGSWLGTDTSTGHAVSSWVAIRPEFSFLLSGYPTNSGNSFVIELLDRGGQISRLPDSFGSVAEQWELTTVHVPGYSRYVAFRFAATDGSRDVGGWLGFSEPFLAGSVTLLTQILSLVAVFLTALAAFSAYFLPGLWLRSRLRLRNAIEFPFAATPTIGILLMAFFGLVIWLSSPIVRPQKLVFVLVLPFFVFLAWCLRTESLRTLVTPLELRALLVVGIVIFVASSKATYSLGPLGELYGQTISRTLEVGDRSDSRISYHTVQVISSGLSPNTGEGRKLFSPASFSSRGPIAALAAVPLVLGLGAHVPGNMPTEPWRPYDREGFATYRIAMIAMGCFAFVAFYGVLDRLLGPKFAYFGLLCAVTSPFLFHEVYFTWPKMEATAFVILCALLMLRKKMLRAGFAWGCGYLFHPLVLLSAPALGALLILRGPREPFRKRGVSILRDGLLTGVGLLSCLLIWRILNWRHFEQQAFLSYFSMPAHGWWPFRLDSLLNTVVPIRLFAVNPHNPSTNVLSTTSPDIIRFFSQYWNTLPFGFGLIAFPILVAASFLFVRKHPVQFISFVLSPFLLFWLYWGASSSGLLREGMHVWFFTVVYAVALICYENATKYVFLFRIVCLLFALRAVEILAMLMLPALVSNHAITSKPFWFNDAMCVFAMIIGVSCLCLEMASVPWRYAPNQPNDFRWRLEAKPAEVTQPAT